MKKWLLFLLSAMIMTAAAPSPKAEKEVMDAMEAYRNAMLKRDGAALEKLFHPDLTYSHSSGKLESKTEAIQAATKGPNSTESMEYSDLKTRVYGTTALVRGVVKIRSNNAGKVQTLDLSVLHVWLKTPQGWQLVARQSTRMLPAS